MPQRRGKFLVPRWIAGGFLAAVFLSNALAGFYFSFAHVLLDLAGSRAEGRIVEIRDGTVWHRFTMQLPVYSVRYSFDTVEGKTVTGVHAVARSTLYTLGRGGAVSVNYLRLLPALNRVERLDRGFIFVAFAALTLVCLLLAGMSFYRGFVPPHD